MALALAGSWRHEVTAPALTADELEAVTPGLLASAGASLCWRRIRSTPLATTASGVRLREAYRLHRLQATLGERTLGWIVRVLRAAGIEPLLLAKGWAVARHYPEPGLRPYGDVDVFVGMEQYSSARAAFKAAAAEWIAGGGPIPAVSIDVQRHPVELDDRPFEELRARAHVVPLGDLRVCVLGPEDQLRMSLLHLLRHEGRRPLWWCDIGAIVETTPSLDWDLVLRGGERRAVWLACMARLAHELLDVRLTTLPQPWQGQPLPGWLAPAIYRRWEDGVATVPSRFAVSYLRNPRGLRQGLYERWPNPLAATLRWGGLPHDTPRWPYQWRDILWRLSLYGRRHLPILREEFARRELEEQRDVVDGRRLSI